MAVVGFEIQRRAPYAGGQEFGESGPYERIDGVISYAVDPEHEANGAIVDLALAPRDGDGRVRFSGDLSIVKPLDAARGNGRLLVEMPNRGRRLANGQFNRARPNPSASPGADPDPGDGFLHGRGWTIASVGWQHDVIRDGTLLGFDAPAALIDGRAIRGSAIVEIRPSERERTRLLANRVHRPNPVADVDDPEAVLIVRDWEDGPDTVIPRDQWRFAQETGDGVVVPSREHVYLEAGFEPGRYYYLVYTAEGAPVVGTGLLAVRDVASFLRYDDGEANPCAGAIDYTYAFGVSQTGRSLRHFLHLGLNVDEQGRMAYDGMLPHVAGGRVGEFNHRFAQPSQQSTPGFGHVFPFADEVTTDPFTEATDGLLRRLRELDAVPKVFYTNSSAEYWRGDGSLLHIDATGEADLAAAPETRIYHFAGTQHGAGSLPQETSANDGYGSRARYGFNVVDYRPLSRAALVNLDRWVSKGVEPPLSRHPRLDDGTAARREELFPAFEAMGLATPDPDRLWVLRTVDLGPDAGRGVGRYPAVEGETYACLVSALDDDGNEVAGVRLPDLTVPVGTHTAWNLRHPETGSPEQVIPMRGLTRFFAPTRTRREELGDPRPSLEERYESRDAYLEQVREAALRLVIERYVLEQDVELIVANTAERYDAAMSGVIVGAEEAATVGD